MAQINESTKKPLDRLRYLKSSRWGFYIIGMISFFLCILTTIFPSSNEPALAYIFPQLIFIGAVAVMVSESVYVIRELLLEHFREIDELKSKVQKLEDKLSQK